MIREAQTPISRHQFSPADEAGDNASARFILTMARALHTCGTPAHRLEGALQACAHTLGLEAQFFSTPTSLFASFGPPDAQRTSLLRVEPGDVDLGRTVELDAVMQAFLRQELDVEQAQRRVLEIMEQPPRYAPWLVTIASSLVSATAAVFFGGNWPELVGAAIIGASIGSLMSFVRRHRQSARLFELAAGMLAAILAISTAALIGPMSTKIAIASGIIILLPGMTMTTAMNELATRHLVSGTSRLVGGLMVLVSLGFGVAIGTKIGAVLPEAAAPSMQTPSWFLLVLLMPVSALAFTVLFSARLQDYLALLTAGLIGFFGSRIGVDLLGPELGACCGAFLVAAAGNFSARRLDRPAITIILPGVILLVPGAIGYQSFHAMMEHNILNGVEAAFTLVLVGVSIVAGLMLAHVAIPPRRQL